MTAFNKWNSLVILSLICFLYGNLYASDAILDAPESLDFGMIETNNGRGTSKRQLSVKNAGSENLVISNIVANCSCVSVQQTTPLTIFPGETALIDLEMSLTSVDYAGREVKLFFKSNSKQSSLFAVKAKGKAALTPYVMPGVIDFGHLKVGERKIKRFRVFVPTSHSSSFQIIDVMASQRSLFIAKVLSQMSTKTRAGFNLFIATIELEYTGSNIPVGKTNETLSIPLELGSGLNVSVIWN
jgi:Protein of unknown function (DUF1573)